MVLCENCYNARYFKFCKDEACYCDATNEIMLLEIADADMACDLYEPLGSDDSE